MRILRFEIQNDRAIECWEHDANGEHVEIAGDAGTGKTTAASALWDIANKSPAMLRNGQSKGHITLHIGDNGPDIVARRVFTPKTNTVTIERADGSAISAKDFGRMLSALSENPHKVAAMKPRERVETLLKAADVDADALANLDTEIAAAEQARLDAHRRAADSVPGDKPECVEAIDVSAVSAELEAVREINLRAAELDDAAMEADRRVAVAAHATADARREVEECQAALRRASEALDLAGANEADERKAAHSAREAASKADRRSDTDLLAQLAEATEVNAKAATFEAWKRAAHDHERHKAQHAQAAKAVGELQSARKQMLETATFPLPGLSIADGDIYLDGILFDNLGTSKQLLVCAALAIKDILAHPLHCVRMDGVEAMSAEDFEQLQELFGDAGIQVISTRVARGDVSDREIVISERG